MIRRLALLLAVTALALPLHAAPSGAVVDTPVASANVTYLGSIPGSAAGGHVKTVNTLLGPKRYFITTGVDGVRAFDITVPEAPVLVTHFPLPNFSNEDVDFGGDLLLITTDPDWVDPFVPGALGGVYILDISKLPVITFAYTNPATGNRWTAPVLGRAGHTISCIRTDCSYAVVDGDNEVVVVDLRTPSSPQIVTRFQPGSVTHDSQLDETGLLWISAGRSGLTAYDMSNPASPRKVVQNFAGGIGYHHNSWRPNAAAWTPRTSADYNAPETRPGELLLVTEETWLPPGQVLCRGQGRFQTRRLRDTDAIGSGAASAVEVLDTWETELAVGNFAAPAAICSAHYFHERDGIVAIAWYNQGVRFLDVSNPRDIRQVGYFIQRANFLFSAEWIGPGTAGGEILYAIDEARGIDILRFDREASAQTVSAPILPEWLEPAADAPVVTPHPTWGFACSIIAS